MRELFKSLIPDIDNLVDKQAAYEQIKRKQWPLSQELKPDDYFELGDSEEGKDMKASGELNHYIKHYLFLLIKL